jgi:hypothetical protein
MKTIFSLSFELKKLLRENEDEKKSFLCLAVSKKKIKSIFIYNFFHSFQFHFIAVLGVNITLIFFGWLLALSSLLLAYGTFKRQSRLCVPYIIALIEAVLLIILLEVLPEFIDKLGVGWFLLLNFLIGMNTLCNH